MSGGGDNGLGRDAGGRCRGRMPRTATLRPGGGRGDRRGAGRSRSGVTAGLRRAGRGRDRVTGAPPRCTAGGLAGRGLESGGRLGQRGRDQGRQGRGRRRRRRSGGLLGGVGAAAATALRLSLVSMSRGLRHIRHRRVLSRLLTVLGVPGRTQVLAGAPAGAGLPRRLRWGGAGGRRCRRGSGGLHRRRADRSGRKSVPGRTGHLRAPIRARDGLLSAALTASSHTAHRGDRLLVGPPGLLRGSRNTGRVHR